MRLVICTDIHGNQDAFSAFQKDMARLRPDQVIFLGDVFGYYYGQNEILTVLRRAGYHCLLGNHDKMFLDLLDGRIDLEDLCKRYGSGYRDALQTVSRENVAFLRTLSPELTMESDGLRLGFFHGSPEDPLCGRVYPDTVIEDPTPYVPFNYLFLGHTHHKMTRQIGHTTVINPGSLGQQRDGKGCSYAVLDTKDRSISIEIVKFDPARLAEEAAVRDPDLPSLREVLYRKPC